MTMVAFEDKGNNSLEQHVWVAHSVLYMYAFIYPSVSQYTLPIPKRDFRQVGLLETAQRAV